MRINVIVIISTLLSFRIGINATNFLYKTSWMTGHNNLFNAANWRDAGEITANSRTDFDVCNRENGSTLNVVAWQGQYIKFYNHGSDTFEYYVQDLNDPNSRWMMETIDAHYHHLVAVDKANVWIR